MTLTKTRKTKDHGMPPEVGAVFRGYAPRMRARLLRLRQIILKTAAKMDGAGALEEILRWGQPAYIAKAGSTIRIDQVKTESGRYAIYFICHTDLVATFRELYPDLDYRDNRCITLCLTEKIPEDALRHCISLALTYRRDRKRAA